MNKKFLLVYTFLLAVLLANAAPINKTQGLDIASRFLNAQKLNTDVFRAKSVNEPLTLAYTAIQQESIPESKALFYVYTRGKSDGFIIVSADSRVKPVLGYADSGKFDFLQMPENMKYWLKEYEEQISYAISNLPDVAYTQSNSPAGVSAQNMAVAPLLGNIAFDQDGPYNHSCPVYNSQRTVTGCVATAMAQVMRYHKWPDAGKGSNTYTTRTLKLNVSTNFTQPIDWANMLPYYFGNFSSLQDSAIARFMFRVGASVNMDYNLASSGGSSAYPNDIPKSLYNYFGYDDAMQIYQRNFYKTNDWMNMLKAEINAGRPILYSGITPSNSGHSFVLDGYDDTGKFHVNWGWSAISNGYFEISVMNPESQGIGSQEGGYNFRQTAVMGIQKPQAGSIHSQIMGYTGGLSITKTSIARTDTFTIKVSNVFNYGAFTYKNGAIGLGLYQGGVFKSELFYYTLDSIRPNYGWSTLALKNLKIPSTLAAGTYDIVPIFKNELNNWTPLVHNQNLPGKYTASVTAANVSFTSDDTSAELQLVSAPISITKLYQNKTAEFDVTIKNTGKNDYNGQLGLRLLSLDGSVSNLFINMFTGIAVGETKTLQLINTLSAAPGDYKVQLFYDKTNNPNSIDFPTNLAGPSTFVPVMTVNVTPDEIHSISITEKLSAPATVFAGDDFTVTAKIQNAGGFFAGDVLAFVFPKTGGTSLEYFGLQTLIIDKNETKQVNFKGNLVALSPDSYLIALGYRENGGAISLIAPNDNNRVLITLEPRTGIFKNEFKDGFRILSNPVQQLLVVSLPENAETASVYDMQGREYVTVNIKNESRKEIPVSSLSNGIYILKVKTDKNTYTAKFIKK